MLRAAFQLAIASCLLIPTSGRAAAPGAQPPGAARASDPIREMAFPGMRSPASRALRVQESLPDVEQSTAGWHELPPPRRSAHVAVYDSRRNRLVVCCGSDHASVWAFDLGRQVWRELAQPVGAHPPGAGACGIYDPVRDRVVVFGGRDLYGQITVDTWAFSFQDDRGWEKLPATGPGPLEQAAAVYDPSGDRMILFGGLSGIETKNDLYILDLAHPAAWKVTSFAGTGPSSRAMAAVIVDRAGDRLTVIGGYSLIDRDGILDYRNTGDSWGTRLSSLGDGEPAVWDSLGGDGPTGPVVAAIDTVARVILACARSSPDSCWTVGSRAGAAWSFAGATPRGAAWPASAAVAPLADGGALLSGGWRGGRATGELWRLQSPAVTGDIPTWTPLVRDTLPPARFGHRVVADPGRDAMVMTCGFSFHDFVDEAFSDVWRYEFARSQWVPLVAPGGPVPGRLEPAVVADCFHDRLVMFGGFIARSTGDVYFRDLWQLPLGGNGAWSPLEAAGDPPAARWGQSSIFDPLRRRMVVFGGRDSLGEFSSTVTVLELADVPRWVTMNPAGLAPIARGFHTAVYDPLRDEMIVFGGLGPTGPLGDTWSLSLDEPRWTELQATGSTPAPRLRHSAAFDADHDLMVMQGGFEGHGDVFSVFGDGAALSLREGPTWTRALGGPDDPLWREGAAMAPDPVRGDVVLYGGVGGGFDSKNDLWRYEPVAGVASPRMAWLLGVDRSAGRPVISWYAPGLQGLAAVIEQSVDGSAWSEAAVAITDPEAIITFPGAVQEPGHSYRYRLRLTGRTDPGVVELPVRVGDLPFLYPAQPNPARASFDVRFLLPTSAPARLDLYDLQGRSVFHRDVGDLGAGAHRLTVAGLHVPQGIYLIRLATPGSVAHARVAILR